MKTIWPVLGSSKEVNLNFIDFGPCTGPRYFIPLFPLTVGLNGDLRQASPHESAVSIPPGHMWLEGDNRECSNDSRNYGPIPMGLLLGKVVIRLFPYAKAEHWKME